MTTPLLEVQHLKTSFFTSEGVVPAVNDISFSVETGKTLGIVGESGCGKSVTSLSIMGLLPQPTGKVQGGKVLFEGTDLLQLTESEMRNYRGKKIAMVFQEPMTSLNPVFTIGNQIEESLVVHEKMNSSERRDRVIDLLRQVGIPSPERRVRDYPHQLSGGMRQRVMIAMSLACNPSLLIADEPTTALDVTVQAQILDLLLRLQRDRGMGLILITHDLGVVAEAADEIAVMYAGRIVESGSTSDVFSSPSHPYTQGLLQSIPSLTGKTKRLKTIPGSVPSLLELPRGCAFQERCSFVVEDCRKEVPELRARPGKNHWFRCVRDVYE